MVTIVKSADTEAGNQFLTVVEDILNSEQSTKTYVAFDCEGVNLSRIGTVEVVSICFPSMEVFLVDFGGNDTCPRIIQAVKRLFESNDITKIIHDCRMDCDALFHLHGIVVNNIHDTSCFHHLITGREDQNLNDVLHYNGIDQNTSRDKNVYKTNPSFWAIRPLNKMMIDWSSSDVDKLFNLASIQMDSLPNAVQARALAKSTTYSTATRDMKIRTGMRVRKPGLFIGRGGENIRSLTKRTGTHIYQDRSDGTWFVFYPTEMALATVKRMMEK